MDALIEQTSTAARLRLSGVKREKTEETGSIRDRRVPPQETQSFKEKKKSQNWFQRQFSRQMRQDSHSSDGIEHVAAVAAAAFAVKRLEETGIPDQKKTSEHPETSLTSIKSKEDKPSLAPEPGRTSKRFSGETSIKISKGQDSEIPITDATTGKKPEKPIGPAPSIKKSPTFSELMKSNVSIEPETAAPKPELPATIKPAMPPNKIKRQSSTKPGIPPTDPKKKSSMGSVMKETKADAWEKAELAKIKDRYEKLKSTIASWEEKKKAKAKIRLYRTESKLAGRRQKALQEFGNDIEYIGQIEGGARAQAEERQRKEEFKAKEKANSIRTTGKDPKTCFCF